jgi:HAD superfamily hydrolase (TIGR01509 family)
VSSSPKPLTIETLSAAGYRIDAVLLDFDGTLTRPGALDFAVLKRTLGCPEEIPVLEFLAGVADENRRTAMAGQLHRFEMDAAALSAPNAGAERIVAAVRAAGLPVGILTRNSRAAICRALENFADLSLADIDTMVTREDPVRIKPSGEGVLLAAERMGVDPHRLLLVGDYRFDMEAGRDAGALTAFLTNGHAIDAGIDCHFTIPTLADLEPILEAGLALPAGKLPNSFLGQLLETYRIEDPSVIVGPSVGEDTAAVDISGREVLVLKTDPITFATESIGRYAVLINANDMATAGTDARWMLATLLLPRGFSRSQVKRIFADLHDACKTWGIILCGGHSEITDAVVRPVVSGMMAGTICRRDLIQKRGIAPGDRILMTKAVAVEGTAIIAAEFSDLLLEKGMRRVEIDGCHQFQSMLSILPEARLAWKNDGVTALHDVTEGGIATALAELSQAGDHGMRIRCEAIPIYAQTRRMTDLLGIDPLGLIGSGSLLICCRPASAPQLMAEMGQNGISVTDIGVVTDQKSGITAHESGEGLSFPVFAVDEITRLYRSQ